jgi:hypothetical protein
MKRLLLTTAIGLALGSAAFAQTAANPSTTPAAAQAAPPAPAPITLSAGVSVAQPDLTRITDSVARMTVKPLRGVDFSVSVGSRVPRELRVYRLPADVVQIVPQYRDYRFLVVEKDIVIVEPSANKIVAILPRDPAITTAAAATASTPPAAAPAPRPAVTPAPAAAPTAAAAPTPAASTAAVSPAPATATPATTATAATTAAASPSPAAPASSTPSAQAPDQAVPAGQASAEPERPTVKKQASRSQRMSRARDDARRARAEVRVGQRVPDNVPLYALPPSLGEPMAREYRYTPRSYATGSRGRIYYEYD